MTTAPPHRALALAQNWHLAGALVSLKRGVDGHWPKRDKRSDGGIGDKRHQAKGSKSDHNPWLNLTVRAYDFDVDGINEKWLAENLRLLGLAGDPRLAGRSGDVSDNGYVIYFDVDLDRPLITSPDFTRWLEYDGDPHKTALHVSVTREPAGYEDARPWDFLLVGHPVVTPAAPAPAAPAGYGPHPGNHAAQAPHPDDDPVTQEPNYPPPGADAVGSGAGFRAQFGNHGPKVAQLQAGLNSVFPLYSALAVDEDYGPNTAAVVEEFARRAAEDTACPQDDREGLRQADGNNVGPRLARALVRFGVRV
jgi:hypothetical protein